MPDIWEAAFEGDVGEVERLVGQDPGLLNARDRPTRWTPLMFASAEGHVRVVRCLLDKGAAINDCSHDPLHGGGVMARTPLWVACCRGRTPVVRLLLEGGGDPTIAGDGGSTPLILASDNGHLEVVRMLLSHPSAKGTIDHRDRGGETALWSACHMGRGAVVRALLESGADPTIADDKGTTPMAIAKQDPDDDDDDHDPEDEISATGRRECVAALEVRSLSCLLPLPHHLRS
jgi:ankyrin repeat protein